MSIHDLDLILNKEDIIATYPACALEAKPAEVEQVYAAHARTHISLGDTERYVETILRWVSGANKGAFIGAVIGKHGEGKTSFLVHVWAKSVERKVFAIPPFEWAGLSDAVTAVHAWTQYILSSTHSPLARKIQHLYEEFRRKSLEQVAHDIVRETGQSVEAVLAMLKAAEQQGRGISTDVTPARFLDFCAEVTACLKEAGYPGLLVLLDEPEVTAQQIGREKLSHLLFDLADELHRRDGDYGVFLSMPEKFLADVQSRFPALTARLEVRGCLPRLGDLYGPDFARDLWTRYVAEFALGEVGERIVSPLALAAIGQVGSSDRSDLSFGPRTVVSAFRRMVFCFKEQGKKYEPNDFVRDCIDQEIKVTPEYRTAVQEVLRSPELTEVNRDAVCLLAAFPNGLPLEAAQVQGVERALLDLHGRSSLVYKTPRTFGLRRLRKQDGGPQGDPLRDAILEINNEFAADRATCSRAIKAFVKQFTPLPFPPRAGQQLVGWEKLSDWTRFRGGAWVATFIGAFPQTKHQYPRRAIIVIVSELGDNLDNVTIPGLPEAAGPRQYDALIHFQIRWQAEQEMPAPRLEVKLGSPAKEKPAQLRLTTDLHSIATVPDALLEMVGEEHVTVFWLLNLLDRMEAYPLPHDSEGHWKAMRDILLRNLIPVVLDDELASLAQEQLGQPISAAGLDFLGSTMQKALLKRYPNYCTLIRQPQWQDKVNDYVRALKSNDVPLAAKRGREKWRVDGDVAARTLGTSRMNLTGGAFEGFESLLTISSSGRSAPLEISFHIHPLERQIAELIASDREGANQKTVIRGKECRYIPLVEVHSLIKESGYTVEELAKIVEIGISRKSFGATQHHGERILYVEPVDPEQMRQQLLEKFAELTAQIEEYKKIPNFVSRLDVDDLRRAIFAVRDEADYENLVVRLNKEFANLQQWLPSFFERLEGKLREVRKDTKEIAEQIANAREVAILQNVPTGRSRWCGDLSRYIVGNLRRSVDEIRNEAKSLTAALDTHIARYVYQGGRPADNIALWTEGNSAAIDAENQAAELKKQIASLIRALTDYEKWLGLLRRSDEVFGALLQLQSEAAHKSFAEGLLAEYDKICRDISDHLEVRNIQGLAAHRQFAVSLDEVDDKRKRYLSQLKESFDRQKAAVNDLLDKLNLGCRVTTVFNPVFSEASYAELYEQGARHIQEAAVSQLQGEVAAQMRELKYARDVLKAEADFTGYLAALTNAADGLCSLERKITTQWLQEVVAGDGAGQATEVAAMLKVANEAIRSARQLGKSVSAPNPPTAGKPKQLHDLVPQQGRTDLKDLILQMMANTDDPSRALDESLECLGELFRRNCVQITVERSGG